MKNLKDAALIAILAVVIGFGINTVRNMASLGGLPLHTPWPDNRKKAELEFPPSYDPAADTLVGLEEAYSLFLSGSAIFIDAREQQEYDEGHIKGALNLPFELWDDYWAGVGPSLDPQKEIVVYCGGLDCELSLFAARQLKSLGYAKAYTFFGGWQKWGDAGLPTSIPENGDD